MDAAARTTAPAGHDAARTPDGEGPHDPATGQPSSPVPENLSPHLHDVFRSSEQTPSGRSFFAPDDHTMRDLAQRVQVDERYYVVDGHGGPDGMRVGDQQLTAGDVAEMIRSDPNWDGREVMLIVCEAGQGPDSFASQLARELGGAVTASPELAWTDNDGRVFSSSNTVDADGTRGPTWPPDGSWSTHQPDGTVDGAGQDGFSPGQEPDTTTPEDAGAVDRTPDDLQMGDDGRLHREGDPDGWFRTEDGKLHHPDDPPGSFRDEGQSLRGKNGGFIDDHLTKRDIDFPADEGDGRSYGLTDDARGDIEGLVHDRGDLWNDARDFRRDMDPHMREFGVNDPNELSPNKLKQKMLELESQIENGPYSLEEKAAKMDRLQDLRDLASDYHQNQQLLKDASEQMGMVAAVDFATNGRSGTLLTPLEMNTRGTSGTIDVVSFVDGDPPRLVCVEAKGGGSELGTRIVGDGKKAEQGSPAYLQDLLGRDRDLRAALEGNPDIRAKIHQALVDGTLEVEYHRVHSNERGDITQSEFNLEGEGGTPFKVDRIAGATPVDGQGRPDPSAAARDSAPSPPESAVARSAAEDSAQPPTAEGDAGAMPDGPAARSATESSALGEDTTGRAPDAEAGTDRQGSAPTRSPAAPSGEAAAVSRADGEGVSGSARNPRVVPGNDTAQARSDAALTSATTGPADTRNPPPDRDFTSDESNTGSVQNDDVADAAENSDADPSRDSDGDDANGMEQDDATNVDDDSDPAPGHVDPDGIRRFDSDEDGERYGENHLGETYRNLPPDEQNAVDWYTRQSFPNPFLRPGGDLGAYLNWAANDVQPGWHLFDMNGGRAPSIGDIYDAVHRSDLTPDQRHIVNDILHHADPESQLEAWLNYSGQRGFLARYFGTFPTEGDFWHRIDEIDRALAHPLAEGVQVQRGLHDVRFMVDDQGNPLGSGDPRSLVGTTQTEPAYMSTSLGENPTVVDGKPFECRLHLDLPAGAPGLWMGTNSVFPDQRELILPRGTRYRITDVRPDGMGGYDIDAVVVLPGP